MADTPAQRGQRAEHVLGAVRVLGESDLCWADAGRRRRERPVAGVAEHRDSGAHVRLDETKRVCIEPVHSEHGDVVAGIERRGDGAQSLSIGELDERVGLPRDDVSRRDDEAARADPTGPFHAEATGGSDYAYDAVARGDHDRRLRQPRIRWRHARRLSGERREGIDSGEDSEQLTGRHEVIEPAEHRRSLGSAPQAGLAGNEQRNRTEHPDHHEPRHGAEQQPAGGVDSVSRHDPGAQRRARERSERLEEDRADRSPGECRERLVRRLGTTVEECRPDARADPRAERDAGNRERARNQPLPKARKCGEQDERKRADVDRSHRSQATPDTLGRPRGRSSVG
jgi:hypothetical protein